MTCKFTQYNILIFRPPARLWLSPTLQSPLHSPTLRQAHMETPWLTKESGVGSGSTICSGIHKTTLQTPREKLAATMAHHPQGDGQMEQVNQELEQYL